MKKTFLLKIIFFLSILSFPTSKIFTQCPEDKNDLIINTQEKYDDFFKKYPNCDEFQIILINNKFPGPPKLIKYIISLFVSFALVIFALKILIEKLDLK